MLVINKLTQEDIDRMDIMDAEKILEDIYDLASELMEIKAMINTKIEHYERSNMGCGDSRENQ